MELGEYKGLDDSDVVVENGISLASRTESLKPRFDK